jgi:hypothetical protein
MSDVQNIDVLLDLHARARAIGPATGPETRRGLAEAVSRVIRMYRLQGLSGQSMPSGDAAADTFRSAMKLAIAAGTDRARLVAIFNDEEHAADEAGRRDF